jgi:hypothetical protein
MIISFAFDMGPAGFEPANSSARGWHHTNLDNGPLTVETC